MSDLTFMPAAEIAALIQHGKASATEAVDAYLAQIQRHNGLLNAIVTLDEDNARRRAKEADQALARGESCGTLHGVPITIKDSSRQKVCVRQPASRRCLTTCQREMPR